MKEKAVSLIVLMIILMNSIFIALNRSPSLPRNGETSIFERKPVAEQENTAEILSKTSRDKKDKWNLNDTSEWSKFAYVDGNKTRLIVGFDGEKYRHLVELEEIIAQHQASIVNTVSIGGEVKAVVVELLSSSVTAFAEDVKAAGLASYIEPNMKLQAQLVPNDPYWNMQWGPQKIEADWAWNTTVGSSQILVAVIDTGICYTHEDIAANYAANGYDWVNNDPDPMDDHGHGTHCAGIISAVLNNSEGIAGLAQVRVMAEKVLDSNGLGYSEWVAQGIINATDYGAKIISMSLSGYGDSELVHDAVRYAYNARVLLIAAAGNDNSNMKSYPAGYDEVIAVAATNQSDKKADFSNWGDWIELSAPGVDIYSTVLDGYESWSGTSMAAPHVSGVAALIWSCYPDKTRDWVRLWLRSTTDDLGDPGFDKYYGYGRVNARRTVEQTPYAHELTAYEWRTPPYVEPNSFGIINATVLNFGYNDETDVTVQLLANSTLIDFVTIDFLASGNSMTVHLTWNPAIEAVYNVTLYILPVPSETNLENNVLQKFIYVGLPVKAIVLHSAGNTMSEIITNWQELNNEWPSFGSAMIYIDYTTLNKEGITYADIASTEADVLIISCAYDKSAGWQFTDSEIEAIKRYVYEGHGLIATAGTLYYEVPNNNKLASLFGIDETTIWDTTETSLLRLLNTTHPLCANLTNPLLFPQVGTAISSDGTWDSNELIGGEYLALGDYQESAIITCMGLVYISPWLETLPPYYHDHLQLLYNAITWSRYQKPEHELAVSLEAPKHLQRDQSVMLNATVSNMGLNSEADVGLYLLIDDTIVNFTIIPELLAGDSKRIDYVWTPSAEKIYNITAYSPPLLNEVLAINNVATAMVHVRFVMFVLWDDTKDADGDSLTGNYRTLYLLLTANGFVVDELTIGPINSRLLANYDIFVLMDPELDFWASEISDIQNWVRAGGALIVVPDGDYPSTINTLMAPFGVQLTGREGGYGSTSNFVGHPITQSVNKIWVNLVREISVTYPSTNLAWTNESLAFLAATEGGEFVAISDSNVMDNDGLEKDDNTRLTLNIFNWVGTKPEHDVTVWLEAPTFLELGDETMINATVRNRGLSYETNVELYLLINDTIVNFVSISELQIGESYKLSYLWVPLVEGLYNITAYVPPISGETLLTNNIATENVFVSHVPTGTYILVDPQESNLLLNETLTINIKVVNVVNLYGWQIKLYYNPLVLRWLNATYPPGHVFDGRPFNPVTPYNGNDDLGTYIMFFACLQQTLSGFSGNGTLCQINFQAVENGISQLHFSRPLGWEGDTWLIDPYVNDIGFTAFDGEAEVIPEAPDVAIMNVSLSISEAYEKWTVPIIVTVKNQGLRNENFTVTVYYNDTSIETQEIINLTAGEEATLTFHWNTTDVPLYTNYTIWAEASKVLGEVNTDNNLFIGGILMVKKTGDVNGDEKVDSLDLTLICEAFASDVNHLRWNPQADLNNDGLINGIDIVLWVENVT